MIPKPPIATVRLQKPIEDRDGNITWYYLKERFTETQAIKFLLENPTYRRG